MEFVTFVALAFMIMVVFAAVVRDRHVTVRREAEYTSVRDVVGMVQAEILIASSVQDGFRRSFEVPDDVEGVVYTIMIQSDFIIAESAHFDHEVAVPPLIGNVTKGTNIIEKRGGLVYLNS